MSGVTRRLLGGVLAISLFVSSSLSAFAAYSVADNKFESFYWDEGDKYLPISFPYFTDAAFNNVTLDGYDSPLNISYFDRILGDVLSSEYVYYNLPYSGYYTGLDIISDDLVMTDHLNLQMLSQNYNLISYLEEFNSLGELFNYESSTLTVDLLEFSPAYINYNFSIKSSSLDIPSFYAYIYIGNDYSNISGNNYSVSSDMMSHSVTQFSDGLYIHNYSFSLFVDEIGTDSSVVRHNFDFYFSSQFSFNQFSFNLSSVSHPGLIHQGTIQSTMTSLFDRLIAWINGIRDSQNDDYIAVTDPSTSQDIQDTQDMIDNVEDFEASLNQNITTEFNKIDFTTPTNLAAPVAFVADKVTRSINSLGSGYQPLVFVPLTLGIMLIFLGRGVTALGQMRPSSRFDPLDHIRDNSRDERWLW